MKSLLILCFLFLVLSRSISSVASEKIENTDSSLGDGCFEKAASFSTQLNIATHLKTLDQASEGTLKASRAFKILVIDDDKLFRKVIISEVIGNLDPVLGTIEVSEASDGEQGWAMMQEPGVNYDLVITDYSMPKMSGIALIQKILRVNKEMKIILFSSHDLAEEGWVPAGVVFILKHANLTEYEVAIVSILGKR